MTSDANISLSSNADFFDVYIVKGDSLSGHFKSGALRKWEEKDGFKSAADGTGVVPGAIPLVLKPGEEALIYDRRSRRTFFVSTIRLLSTEKLIQHKYIDYVDSRENYFEIVHLQEAFVLGLLMLTIFLNLFFYNKAGEKFYLHFALYALFLSINRLSNISYAYTGWEQPYLFPYVRYLGYAWAFIPYFLIQFFRYFLNTKTVYLKWDKVLNIAAISNIVASIFTYFSEFFLKNILTIFYPVSAILSFFLIPILIIITLFLFIKKKENSTRFLIIGAMPLLLLFLVVSPIVVFGVEGEFRSVFMYHFRLIEVICVSWLVLFFSLILSLRFERLRDENMQQALENERLAREKEIERIELIEKQKEELEVQVAERTADLKLSLDELKSTQAQLIQSEKMASLGELTAGIAHEIQNPLNFVNNFSEVNSELLNELVEEVDKGNIEEVKLIVTDIKENSRRINNHGKRADAIVKGMLAHSRMGTGKKELTDLNALTEEYLRLSYHGMQAKNKNFSVTYNFEPDPNLPKLEVIPQDIGRVLLNIFNNAFQASENYDLNPLVTVSTRKLTDKIQISVNDNGPGIPLSIIDKIFQPFFTTRPTGQGTGLGLSLSYDIIQGHGGEITVNTRTDGGALPSGTEFIITLPYP